MPRIQAGEQRDRRAPWQVRPQCHPLLPTQPHCPSISSEAEHRPGKVCELVEGHCFADKQVQLLQGLLSAPPDSLSPRLPPSTCPSPSFESQHPRCTNEPRESFQHPGTFSNRDPGAFDFRILSSPQLRTFQTTITEMEQNSTEAPNVPSSGPSLTPSTALGPHQASWSQ